MMFALLFRYKWNTQSDKFPPLFNHVFQFKSFALYMALCINLSWSLLGDIRLVDWLSLLLPHLWCGLVGGSWNYVLWPIFHNSFRKVKGKIMAAHNCFKIFPEASLHKWVFFAYIALLQKFEYCKCYVQGVPPPTKPGSSLIILPLIRILQRNLKRTHLIV